MRSPNYVSNRFEGRRTRTLIITPHLPISVEHSHSPRMLWSKFTYFQTKYRLSDAGTNKLEMANRRSESGVFFRKFWGPSLGVIILVVVSGGRGSIAVVYLYRNGNWGAINSAGRIVIVGIQSIYQEPLMPMRSSTKLQVVLLLLL